MWLDVLYKMYCISASSSTLARGAKRLCNTIEPGLNRLNDTQLHDHHHRLRECDLHKRNVRAARRSYAS